MSKSVTTKLIEFYHAGVVVEGGSRSLLAAASLAAASAIVLAAAYSPVSAEELNIPSLDPAASAQLAQNVQARLDGEYPDNTILVIGDTDKAADAFAVAMTKANPPTCIVYAQPFESTQRALPGVDLGNVRQDAHALFKLWSSVGTCLGAESPAIANAFGVMMASHETGSSDFPEIMAAWTDLQELRGAMPAGAFWADTAYQAAEAMSSNPVRNAIEVFGASAALDFASKMTGPSRVADKWRIGNAIADALKTEHHYIPVEGGLVDTDAYHWMRHSQTIPEIAQYLALYDYLHEGGYGRIAPDPHQVNVTHSAFAVDMLAVQGDSTARALSSAYGLTVDYAYEPIDTRVTTRDRNEVRGVFFDIDLAGLYVTYAKDGTRFAVSEEDRRPIAFAETVVNHEENVQVDGKITRYDVPAEVAALKL